MHIVLLERISEWIIWFYIFSHTLTDNIIIINYIFCYFCFNYNSIIQNNFTYLFLFYNYLLHQSVCSFKKKLLI